jgi:uncharacterized protein YjbI with pentapeptide repeats
MDRFTRRRRRLPRLVLLGAVLLVALLATPALAPDQAHTTVQAATRALAGWLRQTMWAWPLAAALTLAALSSPLARRRWPRPTQRIPPAIAGFVVLVALAGLATASRPRLGVLAVGVTVAVGLLAAWVLLVPRRLAPPVSAEVLERLSDRDRLEVTNARLKLQNDLRTTALQAIAGLAVLAGAFLGFRQLTEDRQQATATRELTLQGQASERFTRAIDQLGSDRLEVQLGGIYGLEQIAKQAPDNRLPVTEVLVAYLHRRVPRPAKPPGNNPVEGLRTRAPDAQAALTVLGRRETADDDPPLDLHGLDLGGADLGGAVLHDANLNGAELAQADLWGAGLARANLGGADLRGAILFRADLTGAVLRQADLAQATLSGADLRGAVLQFADLHGAVLHGTDLTQADLNGANLRGANLASANLTLTDLTQADLRGASLLVANLSGADLARAHLAMADLSSANLRGANFTDATADQGTAWPDRFDPRGAGVQLDGVIGA